jgi:hypothetical protein
LRPRYFIILGGAALLVFAACGGPSGAEAPEVRFATDESSEQIRLVGTFPAVEAIERAKEIVDFDILVPDTLPHDELRLRQVVAAINALFGRPSLVYSELSYYSGPEYESGSPALVIRQFAPGRMANPPEGQEEVRVLTIGSSKVYATGQGAVTMTVIGEEHPTFSITFSSVPEDDVLAMIRSLIDQ